MLWSDGRFVYALNPARNVVFQLAPSQQKRIKLQTQGEVAAYEMKQLSPAGDVNPDFAAIGFSADATKAFLNFRSANNSYAFTRTTKCDLNAMRETSAAMVQRLLSDVHVR